MKINLGAKDLDSLSCKFGSGCGCMGMKPATVLQPYIPGRKDQPDQDIGSVLPNTRSYDVSCITSHWDQGSSYSTTWQKGAGGLVNQSIFDIPCIPL